MAFVMEMKFRLAFGTRKDEDTGVFVGYCPLLNIYSQGDTDAEAEKAIIDAAQLFIVTCYRRNTLGKLLRNRGMVDAAPRPVEEGQHQYIAVQVQEISDYDRQFEYEVPVDLLAAAGMGQESLACR